MIPCIKNKCLKYPVCKHKVEVECTALRRYNALQTNKSFWRSMRKHLPKVVTIEMEVREEGRFTVCYPPLSKPEEKESS